jgi:hypothetical protein
MTMTVLAMLACRGGMRALAPHRERLESTGKAVPRAVT